MTNGFNWCRKKNCILIWLAFKKCVKSYTESNTELDSPKVMMLLCMPKRTSHSLALIQYFRHLPMIRVRLLTPIYTRDSNRGPLRSRLFVSNSVYNLTRDFNARQIGFRLFLVHQLEPSVYTLQ
jgi:hypothetical protein